MGAAEVRERGAGPGVVAMRRGRKTGTAEARCVRERDACASGDFFFFLKKALFTLKKNYKIEIIAISFVFDKYCPIMN